MAFLTLFHCVIAEKVIIVLRDGKKLIGVLRSYDQFGAPYVGEGGGDDI
jgi:small nuclear ribonucleoprotein (snRNP)-like protein